MTKAERIGEIDDGDVYQVALPFDEQLDGFRQVGAILATPAQIAKIRLAGVSDDYSRTRFTPIALKGEPTVLTKDDLLINPIMAKAVVEAHKRGEYLFAHSGVYESARDIAKGQTDEPEDRTAIILSQSGDYSLTPEMDESRFILENQTREYFKQKVPKGTISLLNLQGDSKKQATINYLWFGGPQQYDSYLLCGSGDLNYHDGAFAVSPKTAEGGSQNSGFRLTEVRDANLRGIVKFLEQREITGLATILEGIDKAMLDELRSSIQ